MKHCRYVRFATTYFICVSDLIQYRLDLAKKMGADEALRFTVCDKEEDIFKKMTEALGGQPDVTFDTTSTPVCIRASVQVGFIFGFVVFF